MSRALVLSIKMNLLKAQGIRGFLSLAGNPKCHRSKEQMPLMALIIRWRLSMGRDLLHMASSNYSNFACLVLEPSVTTSSDMVDFLTFRVFKDNLPVLDLILRTYPSTFAAFKAKSPLGGGMFLDNLAKVVSSLQTIDLKHFDPSSIGGSKGAIVNLRPWDST